MRQPPRPPTPNKPHLSKDGSWFVTYTISTPLELLPPAIAFYKRLNGQSGGYLLFDYGQTK